MFSDTGYSSESASNEASTVVKVDVEVVVVDVEVVVVVLVVSARGNSNSTTLLGPTCEKPLATEFPKSSSSKG